MSSGLFNRLGGRPGSAQAPVAAPVQQAPTQQPIATNYGQVPQQVQQGYQQGYQPPQKTHPLAGQVGGMPTRRRLFHNLSTAKARVGGNYDKVGTYWEKIIRIKQGVNNNIPFTVIEKQIIRIISVPPNAVGHQLGEETTDFMSDKNPQYQYHDKELMTFMVKVLSSPEQPLTQEMITEDLERKILDQGALEGIVVEQNNFEKIGKVSKNPRTVKNYIREVPPAEVKAFMEQYSPQMIASWFPHGFAV